MAKEAYIEKNFRGESLRLIGLIDGIIKEYRAQGLRMTLRQTYYQLVARDVIPNKEESYKMLSGLLSNARLAGLIDWDAIEDRVRQPRMPLEFTDLKHRVESAVYNYRLPRWAGQEYYVELHVEKDAIANILSPIASRKHITLSVNRGYSSQSAMYESAQRFKETGKPNILFYLGDLDPSGEDMVRDIRDRLEMFGVENIEVQKLALTWDQVQEYKPPTNPAKFSDPRAKGYVEKYGKHSWEVDALNPRTLTQIITDSIDAYLDQDAMDAVIAQEESDKKRLRKAVEEIMKEKS